MVGPRFLSIQQDPKADRLAGRAAQDKVQVPGAESKCDLAAFNEKEGVLGSDLPPVRISPLIQAKLEGKAIRALA